MRPASRPGPGRGGRRAGLPGLLRWLGAAAVLTAAVAVAVSQRHELVHAYRAVLSVSLPRLGIAVICEALSLVCLAAVQRWLLRAGRHRWSLRRVLAIVLGANAVAGALPGGAAFAGAWMFRQLNRRGVQPTLSAAVLLLSAALSALGLVVLATGGLAALGLSGAEAVVYPVAGGLAAAAAAVAAALALLGLPGARDALRRGWGAWGERYARVRRVQRELAQVVNQAESLRPGPRPWLLPASLALLNWGLDAACLTACIWALGVAPPWHGLLLVYVLTQVAGGLRLTPGGLGIVEAGLSALLVLHGLRPGQAIAATLLYRAVSYWALQPVGWACWLGVTGRRGSGGTER